MFRLTREVRFGINPAQPDPQWESAPTNSHGGYPSLTGFGTYLTLNVTLSGELDPQSQYLINIKRIDAAARELLRDLAPKLNELTPTTLVRDLFAAFEKLWRDKFESVSLNLSPFLSLQLSARDGRVNPMMKLSQKFEFSASHRLHNPSMSDEENRACFGKCSNPSGHGHNYEVQVTLRGSAAGGELMIDTPRFEKIVAETVIEKFDHKNLNVEVTEFRDVIPSVENIAMVIYRLLKPKFAAQPAQLAAVTVWETPKTWCEYSE